MKGIILSIVFGVVVISFAIFFKFYNLPSGIKPEILAVQQIKENIKIKNTALNEPEENVSLVFVGDVMLDRGVKQKVEIKFNGEYEKVFEFVKAKISSADFSVLNLEGPVSDRGSNVGSIYSFRMATGTFPALYNAGFDIVSFSNNHIGDWGRLAFEDTLVRAKEANLSVLGAGQNYSSVLEPLVVNKKNIKIGFLSFSDVGPYHMKTGTSTSGILLLSDPNLETIIKNAKREVDQLVVSVHWGEEYKIVPTERQKEFGHKLIDWGVSLVVGHHPHVIEPIEEYNSGLIAYSLGNFVFDQYFSKETMEGGVLFVKFNKNKIEEYTFEKVEIDEDFRPSFVINL